MQLEPLSTIIAIYGLEAEANEEFLWDVFGKFGAIRRVALVKDPVVQLVSQLVNFIIRLGSAVEMRP